MSEYDDPPIHPALDAYGRREQARTFTTPPGFAHKVQYRLAAEHRRRRRIQRFAGMALAASLLLTAGFFALPRQQPQTPTPAPEPVELASVKLGEEWSEAGRSLENLTNRATEPAVAPAKRLLEGSSQLQLPDAVAAEPGLPSIEFVPVAMAGLEPVTSTPRRAFQMMMRDFGLNSQEK